MRNRNPNECLAKSNQNRAVLLSDLESTVSECLCRRDNLMTGQQELIIMILGL